MTPTPTPPTVCTVDPGVPFVDALAAGIRAAVGDDPAALTEVRVIVPNRRACRALGLAFLRQTAGRPLLLPQMTPLGDLDEDEIFLDDAADTTADDLTIPPAITPLRRQLLLTRLVLAARQGRIAHDQAVRLARELARLLDQIQTERLDFRQIKELVPAELARHWQITLDFLSLLTEHWPRILAEEATIDPAERRNRLLAAQAAAWRRKPPAFPVYAAGSTGSIPASAELLQVVACLPQGAVVLPGLDLDADEDTWTEIAADPGHPQFGMARLLDRIGIGRPDVRRWPGQTMTSTSPARAQFIHRALRPAACVTAPVAATGLAADAIADVVRIDTATPEDEARLAALILREALQRPEQTAALVTPDRALARRVAAELRRWDIDIDDSGGQPLAETPPGLFLRLVAAAVAAELAPVPLLALLKHPLAGCGLATAACRARTRALEQKALRGPRPAPGIAGLRACMTGDEHRDVHDLLRRLERSLEPLVEIQQRGQAALSEFVAAHIEAAEATAATDDETGAARLWAGDTGEAAAAFIAELSQSAPDFSSIAADSYLELIEVLMDGRVVRPRYGRHPRLAIWGPLEARLQHADVMVLGSLNEDTWPPKVDVNPWMSRPMMKAFGLPLPERRIGLSAHDFAQAFCAGRVFLTRADRKEGAPTVPSRWLFRIDTLVRGSAWEMNNARRAGRWLAWQRALDAPAQSCPTEPPAPRPPVTARPRKLSVTQVETWMRDPYATYARHVLGLKALDPIDADPGAAEYGSTLHKAFARFLERYPLEQFPGSLPADALDRLLAIGQDCFGAHIDRPGVRAFWWPRFERIAAWFVDWEQRRRPRLQRSASEIVGRLMIAGALAPFQLTAVADRLDRRADGGLDIIDYKTGVLPRQRDVDAGFACQLPLEAAIAKAGGFGAAFQAAAAMTHCRLSGGDPAGEEKPLKDGNGDLADQALAGLTALINAFDRPDTPYLSQPRPAFAPRFSDYAHLARVKERAAGGGDGE
jgi:ATP-dependent helicase/nuclease subunit B